MKIEAVLLTGGASSRFGADKASVQLGLQTLGQRTAEALRSRSERVTVLGREPLKGYPFQPDQNEFAGPLAALSRFKPSSDFVFVASCDMPRFDPGLIESLQAFLAESDDAAVPVLAGMRQPTCALYRSRAFGRVPEVLAEGKRSLMAWLERLAVVEFGEDRMREAGLRPTDYASFNTPEELQPFLDSTEVPEPPPKPAE